VNFPYLMVLWGAVMIAVLAGYAVGRRHAAQIAEADVFARGVQAERHIQHAKHSEAVKLGHLRRKVRDAKRDEELRKAGLSFPRPMGVERPSDGAA